MAKKQAEPKVSAASQPEASFVDLMMVAADFVKSCGGVNQAKKCLEVTGKFIERASTVAQAAKALDVLESLRSKISE